MAFANICTGYSVSATASAGAVITGNVSGTWSNPFTLEGPIAAGTVHVTWATGLPLSIDLPYEAFSEAAGCQETHHITYGVNDPICQGWSTWYSVDGGPHIVYASGSWTLPFNLEGVDVPQYTFPKNQGELYDIDAIPSQHVDEPALCQQTHVVIYGVGNDCIGHPAYYFIDSERYIYNTETWTLPFNLESVDVPAFDFPKADGELYSINTIPTQHVDEKAECLVTQNTFSVEAISGCDGYWQVNHASPGAVITGDFYGVWTKPFELETAPGGDVTATWTTGLPLSITVSTGTFVEPKDCLVTENTLSIKPESNCQGYWTVWNASSGAVITDVGANGGWSDPFTLESAPGGNIVATWATGLPLSITIPTGTFNEPKDCLVTENTATLAFANICTGYSANANASAGAVITGNILDTWDDPFTLEGPIAAGTVHVTWATGLPLTIDLPYAAFSEPTECLVTENTATLAFANVCTGYSVSADASVGAVITGNVSGSWSNPYTLEGPIAHGNILVTWATGLPLSIELPYDEFSEPETCLQEEPAKPQADVEVVGCGIFPHGVSVLQKVTFTPSYGYFVLPAPYAQEIHTKTTIEMAEGSYVWHFIADDGHDLWGKDFYGTVVVGGSCYKEFAMPPCPTCSGGDITLMKVAPNTCAMFMTAVEKWVFNYHKWGWENPGFTAYMVCNQADAELIDRNTNAVLKTTAVEWAPGWSRLDLPIGIHINDYYWVKTGTPADWYNQYIAGTFDLRTALISDPAWLKQWYVGCSILPNLASQIGAGMFHKYPGQNSAAYDVWIMDNLGITEDMPDFYTQLLKVQAWTATIDTKDATAIDSTWLPK